MEQRRILIVDDDPEICALLERLFVRYGYAARHAGSGREAAASLASGPVDLAIVDLCLPDTDGISLIESLRGAGDPGIILISGLGDPSDRIAALEVGADDFVVKPFDPRELVARARSVLRRRQAGPAQRRPGGRATGFDRWTLDLDTRELTSSDGGFAVLTPGEFDLLKALIDHPNRVLSRDQLLDLTRRGAVDPFDRSIDMMIRRLRQKIERSPAEPTVIKTIRNGGYMFTPSMSS